MKLLCGVLVLLYAAGAINTEDKKAPATESSEAPTSTPTASNEQEDGVVPTDRICAVCACGEDTVDCRVRGFEQFFTAGDWAGLPNKDQITHIDLSGNSIANITPLPELPKLDTLNLSRCGVVHIEDKAFKQLQRLRNLDLSRNSLTSATLSPHVFEGHYSPVSYEPLESMRILDLSFNDLHSLHKDLFEHLPELTELVLDGNPLGIIDQTTVIAIAGLPKLQILKMRDCSLTEIPERFLHTPRDLQHLDISENRLTAVPDELQEAKSLVFLNINDNPIRRIGKVDGLETDKEENSQFPVMPRLEELHMCNMSQLEYIGVYALGGLSNLKILHVSNNPKLKKMLGRAMAKQELSRDDGSELTSVVGIVWPPLEELYISNNNLTEISPQLVSRWDRLRVLRAEGNQYVCDCTTQWMVDELVPIADKLQPDASALFVCKTPSEMANMTMKILNSKHRNMRCLDKYNHRPERDGAILLGALIGVLLAVPLVLSVVLLWRRGFLAPCGAGAGPAGFSRAFYKRAQTEEDMYI